MPDQVVEVRREERGVVGCDPLQCDEQPGGGGQPVKVQGRVAECAGVGAVEAPDESGREGSGRGGVRDA